MAGEVDTLKQTAGGRGPIFWIFGLLPLVLLAGLLALFAIVGPAGIFDAAFPPIEELTIERISFTEDGIEVRVVNGGPEEVTIAQVTVDEAVWQFTAEPDAVLGRLDRATLSIPYPWSEGEPHTVVLISAGGVMFEKVAEVAALSPVLDGRYIATFTLLGVYVGVIPVLMGLLWYPFLRRLTDRWLNFSLSFTVGLLLFLGIDALDESLDFAGDVAAAFQGVSLVAMGFVLAFLAVSAVDRSRKVVAGAAGASTLVLVYSIAVGIGLHNLGEGLAIGAAYTGGSIALGTMLAKRFADTHIDKTTARPHMARVRHGCRELATASDSVDSFNVSFPRCYPAARRSCFKVSKSQSGSVLAFRPPPRVNRTQWTSLS